MKKKKLKIILRDHEYIFSILKYIKIVFEKKNKKYINFEYVEEEINSKKII